MDSARNACSVPGVRGRAGELSGQSYEAQVAANTRDLFSEGRNTFRFDTFGDEDFWGGALQLHQAIEGSAFGGVGPGITPRQAIDLGLKVDADALHGTQGRVQGGQLDLDSPAGTLALLKANAIVGLTGFFNADGSLKSVGIQCALCHSTVDNSVAFGIGRRLDGWANRDLDVGKIVASAPNLTPFATLLGVSVATVKAVLQSWGPGKFDDELSFDGKAFNPQQVSHGVVTGTNVSGATLMPNAYGLAGFNQHTWTGAWGTVTYWNAFVANLEMHGKGRFFDPRLNNPAQFPIAAANGFGDLPHISPDDDRIRSSPGCIFTSWRCRRPRRAAASISTRRRPSAATSSSAARRNATTATSSRCGPSPDGISTSRRRSASTASRPIVRRITRTRR